MSEKQWVPKEHEQIEVRICGAARTIRRVDMFFIVVVLLALLVGLVTAATGCFTGLYSLRQPYSWICLPQRHTVFWQMWSLAKSLNEYKKEHGTYPLTLEEMTSQWKDNEGKPWKEESVNYELQDGWGNPMIYSSDGKTWELLSYGADGKPGGIGLNADIRRTDDEPEFNTDLYVHAKPTIGQMILSEHFQTTAVFSILAGTVGFIVTLSSLFTLKYYVVKRYEVITGIIVVIGIIVMSSFFVAIHAFFQSVASGH